MPRRSKDARRPPRGRAGWYRTRTPLGEQLRYFDGSAWTEQRRNVPFWADGPEWEQVAPSAADIDSDSGFAVRRLFQPARSPDAVTAPRRHSRVRLRAALAWILVAVMVAGTAGSAIIFFTQRAAQGR